MLPSIREAARCSRRFRFTTSVVLLALLLTGGISTAHARDEVLLVGNSFTDGLRSELRWLTRSAGRNVYVSTRASDGWTLQDHLASRSTAAKIESLAWSWVVLQEQSDGMTSDRFPAALGLADEVAADGAQTVFFMTWRDRDADPDSWDTLRGVPGGDTGYVPIAFQVGAPVAPIGWCFRELLLEEPAADLWAVDGHHASARGRYIAALTLYATIYGESPVGLWAPPSLPADQCLHDQLLVERVVLTTPADWNINVAAAVP